MRSGLRVRVPHRRPLQLADEPLIAAHQDTAAEVVADDLVPTESMTEHYPDREYTETAADALTNAHSAVVVTGWDEFAAFEEEVDAMATPVVDGRRIVKPTGAIVSEGLTW